jgi:hypothetical protein
MGDLDMWPVSAKFVRWLFTDEKRQQHVFVFQELLDEVRNHQVFLSGVMKGDETWVCCYQIAVPSGWRFQDVSEMQEQ